MIMDICLRNNLIVIAYTHFHGCVLGLCLEHYAPCETWSAMFLGVVKHGEPCSTSALAMIGLWSMTVGYTFNT